MAIDDMSSMDTPPAEHKPSPKISVIIYVITFLAFFGIEVYAILVWDFKWALVGGLALPVGIITGSALGTLTKAKL